MSGNELRLPQWAQQELRRLRELVRDRDETIRALNGEREGAVVFTDVYGDHPIPVALPNQSVRFVTGDARDEYIDVSVVRHRGKTVINVHASSIIVLEAQASNHMFISTKGF